MRVLPAAPEVPLAAPPAESFDLQDNLTCPACGCPDAAMQLIETVELAKCPQCQSEFPPRVESISRQVIRRISEHRQHRMRRFMERLPVTPPVRGLDAVDYALFRKLVDGTRREKRFEPNQANIDQALAQIRDRFIDQRTQPGGWDHPETGVHYEPVAQAEAEQRWATVAPHFAQVLGRPNEEAARRLRLGTHVDTWETD